MTRLSTLSQPSLILQSANFVNSLFLVILFLYSLVSQINCIFCTNYSGLHLYSHLVSLSPSLSISLSFIAVCTLFLTLTFNNLPTVFVCVCLSHSPVKQPVYNTKYFTSQYSILFYGNLYEESFIIILFY